MFVLFIDLVTKHFEFVSFHFLVFMHFYLILQKLS